MIGLGDRLVSCLMVTQAARWKDGPPIGLRSYQEQSYEPRELVLVTADPCEEMEAAGFDVNVMPAGSTLGQLRQRSLELSSGEYVATWDDDDFSSPDRIAEQLAALAALPLADACLLLRVLIKDEISISTRPRMFVGPRHTWEMTMLARFESVGPYCPELRTGEDSDVIAKMRQIVLLDAPFLYTHVAHPGATVAAKMLSEWWAASPANGGAP